jgi:hypothetical protein
MSLHSLIQKAEVRQGFGARLLRPRAKLERGLQAPPLTANYEMVSGAFDYLLCFLLERLNPQMRAPAWPAERGVELIRLFQSRAGGEVPTLSGHPRALKAAAYLATRGGSTARTSRSAGSPTTCSSPRTGSPTSTWRFARPRTASTGTRSTT